MDVDMLSFTGSSATGKQLMISAGRSNMKKLVLECGGKSPSIVFDDCPDLDDVAGAVAGSVFWNQGQVCTAGTRLLVQSSVHDELVARVAAQAAEMTPGDPLDPETALGPIVNQPQLDKVLRYIDAGVADGVDPLVGGQRTLNDTGGYFVEATVFDNVDSRMRIAQEEIFGPVLSVIPFADTDEAVRLANDTIYGLSATVWTRDLSRAHHMIKNVRSASISVKATTTPSEGAPIYGLPCEPHGQSGLGVEGGVEGIMAFTELRSAQIFIE
jgi:acyl-CoA reductase-like NAD-dependent aldehyde dehydrogenase